MYDSYICSSYKCIHIGSVNTQMCGFGYDVGFGLRLNKVQNPVKELSLRICLVSKDGLQIT